MHVEVESSAQTLNRIRFTTDKVPPAQRFRYWQGLLEPYLVTTPDPGEDPGQFQQKVDGFNLGDVLLLMVESSPKFFKNRVNKIHKTGADVYWLQVFFSGGCKGSNGGNAVQAGAGDICLLDMSRPVYMRLYSSTNLTLIIPRHELHRYTDMRQLAPGHVLHKDRALTTILGQQLTSFWHDLTQHAQVEVGSVKSMLLGSVAAAMAGSGGVHTLVPDASASQLGLTLAAACHYIDQHLPEDLSVKSLCREFDCSRSTLYRLFESVGGVSAYIQRARLQRCLEELTNPHSHFERIIDVSYYWGFATHSHFCRLFRNEFGLTPSAAVAWGKTHRQTDIKQTADKELPATLSQWYHTAVNDHNQNQPKP